jgi:tripartite ATP-independent transporter DctM subunit
MVQFLPFLLFFAVCVLLMVGYPVAITMAGVSLLFAAVGSIFGGFDPAYITLIPNRIFGILVNQNLFAVPLFVFMGSMLEKSRIADSLLKSMEILFGGVPGGLGLAVILVGMLLAASTGIVCATGTLGQIIPPSICLVLLGEVISNAYQQSQLDAGIFAPNFVSIGDLFAGALLPGLLLVLGYGVYLVLVATFRPDDAPSSKKTALERDRKRQLLSLAKGLLPPVFLVLSVLGSILKGIATPTEAASVGATGAILLAIVKRNLSLGVLQEVSLETMRTTSMIYLILVGATIFSSVFRGFGGEELIEGFLTGLPGGVLSATFVVMFFIFLLGFILDFIEITFMVVPLVGPVLLGMGIDPIWLGVMIAINLQTSFLTPPFGFSLFYLRSVVPDSVATSEIYRGVAPFITIQILILLLIALQPGIATWLPSYFGR